MDKTDADSEPGLDEKNINNEDPDGSMDNAEPVQLDDDVIQEDEDQGEADIEEDDGETVQFLNKRSYQFVPELSSGSESDPVTVLNMVMVTAANKFRDSSYFVSWPCSFAPKPHPLKLILQGEDQHSSIS